MPRMSLISARCLALAAFVFGATPFAATPVTAQDASGSAVKCYEVLDWTEFEAKSGISLKDQYGASQATTTKPKLVCESVSIDNGKWSVSSRMVCYEITDEPAAGTERVKEVSTSDQYHQWNSMWLGGSSLLCVPARIQYEK